MAVALITSDGGAGSRCFPLRPSRRAGWVGHAGVFGRPLPPTAHHHLLILHVMPPCSLPYSLHRPPQPRYCRDSVLPSSPAITRTPAPLQTGHTARTHDTHANPNTDAHAQHALRQSWLQSSRGSEDQLFPTLPLRLACCGGFPQPVRSSSSLCPRSVGNGHPAHHPLPRSRFEGEAATGRLGGDGSLGLSPPFIAFLLSFASAFHRRSPPFCCHVTVRPLSFHSAVHRAAAASPPPFSLEVHAGVERIE